MQFKIAVFICALSVIFTPATASAYIDPGTGSILIQGLIGAIAAIGVTLKLYWHRIIALFRRESSRKEKHAKSNADNEPEQSQ